jgi:hypothetical protein
MDDPDLLLALQLQREEDAASDAAMAQALALQEQEWAGASSLQDDRAGRPAERRGGERRRLGRGGMMPRQRRPRDAVAGSELADLLDARGSLSAPDAFVDGRLITTRSGQTINPDAAPSASWSAEPGRWSAFFFFSFFLIILIGD